MTAQEATRRLLTIARDIQAFQTQLRASAQGASFYEAADACEDALAPLHSAREVLAGRAGGKALPEVEQDPHSGRWYILGSDGERLHGPYLARPRA